MATKTKPACLDVMATDYPEPSLTNVTLAIFKLREFRNAMYRAYQTIMAYSNNTYRYDDYDVPTNLNGSTAYWVVFQQNKSDVSYLAGATTVAYARRVSVFAYNPLMKQCFHTRLSVSPAGQAADNMLKSTHLNVYNTSFPKDQSGNHRMYIPYIIIPEFLKATKKMSPKLGEVIVQWRLGSKPSGEMRNVITIKAQSNKAAIISIDVSVPDYPDSFGIKDIAKPFIWGRQVSKIKSANRLCAFSAFEMPPERLLWLSNCINADRILGSQDTISDDVKARTTVHVIDDHEALYVRSESNFGLSEYCLTASGSV